MLSRHQIYAQSLLALSRRDDQETETCLVTVDVVGKHAVGSHHFVLLFVIAQLLVDKRNGKSVALDVVKVYSK